MTQLMWSRTVELQHLEEATELSATIERIYEAALAPALWPEVLGRIATFVNGYSAAIFSKASSFNEGGIYYHDGRIHEDFRHTYFTQYIKFDPSNTLQYFGEIEKPVSVSSLIPHGELADTRFYREWAEPQGLIDMVTVTLERSAVSAALFGVFRHVSQGLADDLIVRRIGLLAPHIRRAIFIGRAFDIKANEAATLAETLDGFSSSLFLVDRDAHIVHANAVAYRALDRRDLCRVTSGRLTFLDRAANNKFNAALGEFAGATSTSLPDDLLLTLEREDGEPFVAQILPLAFRNGRARNSSSAIAVVYLQRAALKVDTAPTAIAKAYALTPTELRVLLAIVEIGGVPETAESLGIGEGTVKTHLRRVFAKTGATRQADLVRLVAVHSTPMGHRAQNPRPTQLPLARCADTMRVAGRAACS
jgi:DNA-binding CsgD family transcriptional regulator